MKTDSRTASAIKRELLRAEEMLAQLSAKRANGSDDSHDEVLHYWDGKVMAYSKVCQLLHIE